MTARNGEYEKYPDVFQSGANVRCENEWQPGKWQRGTISHHETNEYGIPHWLFIELEDGTQVEFDYRFLDVEAPRNSLVRLVK